MSSNNDVQLSKPAVPVPAWWRMVPSLPIAIFEACLEIFSDASMPLVRVGHGPGEALLLTVCVEFFNALVWACADDVERDLVTVVSTDLFLEAPQLGAAGRSIGRVEVEEDRRALFSESCGCDPGAVEQAHAELGGAQAHFVADFHGLGFRLAVCDSDGLRGRRRGRAIGVLCG